MEVHYRGCSATENVIQRRTDLLPADNDMQSQSDTEQKEAQFLLTL